jgi:hypothetical protein
MSDNSQKCIPEAAEHTKMGQVIHLFTARNWDASERTALKQLKERSKKKFNESSTSD